MAPRALRAPRALAALALLLAASSCASVDFQRTTPSSGTFTSSAWAFTLLSMDFPAPALTVARGNVSDTAHPNLSIEEQFEIPYLGWFDWVLDVVGIRYARTRGTWGYPPEE
ncbi:MAG: hypothetical protein AB1726_04390 [Planctomycetota bacterium]